MNSSLVVPSAEHKPVRAVMNCLLLVLALIASSLASPVVFAQQQDTAPADASANSTSGDPTPDIEPTVVSAPEYNDPLIGINRAVFAFNDAAYRYVVIPLSNGYIAVVPSPVRTSVTNVFNNIKMPVYLVNNLLQGRPEHSLRNLARFGINSTLGLLGLFDVANDWFELPPARTGLNDTLASWQAGYGIYLVLPFLGPSDVRNSIGRIGDQFLNPINYLSAEQDQMVLQGIDNVNGFAPVASRYLELRAESDDPYLFFRNMHLQGIIRDAEYQEN